VAGKLKREYGREYYKNFLFTKKVKTMKTTTITMRTVGVIFSAGILLTSCVSSKKYHRSEAEVARLKVDSTTLAQQGTALQQNLSSAQQQNTDLQKSVAAANTTNAGLQKNVAYYHDYFDKQQAATTQVKDELNTTLAPAGLTDQDVTIVNGKIFVNIGEKTLFKGKTAMLSTKGKELVNNLGQFVKSHEGVDISVADLQMATSATADGPMNNSGTANATQSGTDQSMQPASSANTSKTYTKTKTTNTNNNAGVATEKMEHRVAMHHKKKVQAVPGESKAVAYSSGHHNKYAKERMSRSTARAMAWKRQNVVADALLKNGIPKVKLVSQLPGTGTNAADAQKGLQVVITQDNSDYYKHMSEAPAAGQPVSKNP
jgi:hypothetical protein